MIADERAKINAAENEQANAFKRERAREQSRKRSAVRRERKAKAQLEPGRSEALRRRNGKALTDQEAAALEARLYPERAPHARVTSTHLCAVRECALRIVTSAVRRQARLVGSASSCFIGFRALTAPRRAARLESD
jgi:hypothetical protein